MRAYFKPQPNGGDSANEATRAEVIRTLRRRAQPSSDNRGSFHRFGKVDVSRQRHRQAVHVQEDKDLQGDEEEFGDRVDSSSRRSVQVADVCADGRRKQRQEI